MKIEKQIKIYTAQIYTRFTVADETKKPYQIEKIKNTKKSEKRRRLATNTFSDHDAVVTASVRGPRMLFVS